MREMLSLFVAICAMVATTFNVYVARTNVQATMFAQFQQEYSVVATQFPEQLLEPSFKPPRGSGAYKKLVDYWIFAYAEWFETGRSRPWFFEDLWTDYYSGLIRDATEVPSLRYVLEDMQKDPQFKKADMQHFFDVVKKLENP